MGMGTKPPTDFVCAPAPDSPIVQNHTHEPNSFVIGARRHSNLDSCRHAEHMKENMVELGHETCITCRTVYVLLGKAPAQREGSLIQKQPNQLLTFACSFTKVDLDRFLLHSVIPWDHALQRWKFITAR